MIGLNLSRCVQDIVNGNMPSRYIDRIVAETRVETRKELDDLALWYRHAAWTKYPSQLDQCEALLRAFFIIGTIVQPRIFSDDDDCVPDTKRGREQVIWVENQSDILWNADPPKVIKCSPITDWPVSVIP